MPSLLSLERFAKALADQTRLRILLLLLNSDELCVCDLTQTLALAQPKISRHLAILRELGILLDRKAGLWVYYRIHPELPAWTGDLLKALQQGSLREALYQQDLQLLSQAVNARTACH